LADFLLEDTEKTTKIKSLYKKEEKYADFLGPIETCILSFYHKNKNLTDAVVEKAIKNVRTNFLKGAEFFKEPLEQLILEASELAAKNRPISRHEYHLVLSYILWSISNRNWLGSGTAYLDWLVEFFGSEGENTEEDYSLPFEPTPKDEKLTRKESEEFSGDEKLAENKYGHVVTDDKRALPKNSLCMCHSGRKYSICCMGKLSPKQEEYYWLLHKQSEIREKIISLLEPAGKVKLNGYLAKFAKGIGKDIKKMKDANRDRFFDWLFYEAKADNGKNFSKWIVDSFPNRFDPTEVAIVNEWAKNCFPGVYEVLKSDSENWDVEVQEIMIGKKYAITEKSGAMTLSKGMLVFTTINRIFGKHYFSGMLGQLPESCKDQYKDFIKKEWEKAGGIAKIPYEDFTRLKSLEISTFKPPMPKLLNKYGEELRVCEATYRLKIGKEGLLDWFAKNKDKFEILEVKGKRGSLKAEIAILQKKEKRLSADSKEKRLVMYNNVIDIQGNAISSMGSIIIEKNVMKIFSMSEPVFRKIRQDLEKSFTGKIILADEKIIDPSNMEFDENADEEEDDEEIPEEFSGVLTKHMEDYYVKWCDDKIPALGNITPRQAIKTKEGREKLDALLVQFERDSVEQKLRNKPYVPAEQIIRRELGI